MSVNTTLASRALSPTQAKDRSTAEADTVPAESPGIGFEDVLDAVNPLQQLPVVSAVYRETTGDTISIPSRLAGGLLFGGVAGLIGSAAMVLFEEATGDSVLGHLQTIADGALAEPAAAPGAALPYLARPDAAPPAGTGEPSAAALAEALKRKVNAAAAAGEAQAAAAPALDPKLLAQLYELEATDAREEGAIRL
ncbi:hypothetical protein [Azospirillum sp. ST 5-10]|uniref:hypothetical protein n=1 Tax=unclassified Azospirillum TaxID=2630922 RepID=UPI003F4A5CF1